MDVITIERGPAGLDHSLTFLEFGLGGCQLGVGSREVLDFFVELLLDGAQLLGAEAVKTHC